jgi:hypothetical protein
MEERDFVGKMHNLRSSRWVREPNTPFGVVRSEGLEEKLVLSATTQGFRLQVKPKFVWGPARSRCRNFVHQARYSEDSGRTLRGPFS